jgi:hypothetical protein
MGKGKRQKRKLAARRFPPEAQFVREAKGKRQKAKGKRQEAVISYLLPVFSVNSYQ